MTANKPKARWLKIILYLFTIALLIFSIYNSIANNQSMVCYVVGDSMEPTLHSNQFVFAAGRSFSRGDIVTALLPEDAKVGACEDTKIIIKRIVGVPGDNVTITNDGVFINGELYNEPYLSEDAKTATFVLGGHYNSVTLSETQYFLIGDNRSNSYDSRYFGPVDRDALCAAQTESFAEGLCKKYLLACDCFSLIEVLVKKLIPEFKGIIC